MEKSLSRDTLAVEFAKMIFSKSVQTNITPINRIKRWLGRKDAKQTSVWPDLAAACSVAFAMADAFMKAEEAHDAGE